MKTKVAVARTWDDLVFQDRNREYGAYPLRKEYSKRVVIGWGLTVAVTAILLWSMEVNIPAVPPPAPPVEKVICTLTLPTLEHLKLKKSDVPVRSEKKVKANSVPMVVAEPVQQSVVEEAVDVVFPDSHDVAIGEGIFDGVDAGAVEGVLPAVVEEKKVHDVVEIMPVYDGGTKAMMKFIQKHVRYPSGPRRLGIEGTVFVSFVVNGDGSVSDIKVIRGIALECDEEAKRVVGMLPGWIGGRQNGAPANVRMVLPIKFELDN